MEISKLREIADKYEIKYHNLTGEKKLSKLIADYCKEHNLNYEEIVGEAYKEDNEEHEEVDLSKLSFAKLAVKKKDRSKHEVEREALKLIRCQITCNNPNKRSYQGEIFAARNAVIPEVKKFIPFNVPTHVPQILFNMIKEKQLQMFKKERTPKGDITKPYLVPEYNIQILPPLTGAELEAIKQRQLAERSVD